MNDAAKPTPPIHSGLAMAAVTESVGSVLMKAVFEEISQLRTVWVVTPQGMQQEILDRLRAKVDDAVKNAVRRIASGGFQSAPVQLESMTIKDEVKVSLTLAKGSEVVHAFADRVGSPAVVVFIDPDQYLAAAGAITAQADQGSLPLGED